MRVQGLGFRAHFVEFGVRGLGFRLSGSGFPGAFDSGSLSWRRAVSEFADSRIVSTFLAGVPPELNVLLGVLSIP